MAPMLPDTSRPRAFSNRLLIGCTVAATAFGTVAVAGAAQAADTTPPVISGISLPMGTTGPEVDLGADIVDPESGINKAYVNVVTEAGRHAAGIRLWDDGSHGDSIAGDGRYQARVVLDLADGAYTLSLDTYDSKYNHAEPAAGSLVVSGSQYQWTPLDSTSIPAPTPSTSTPSLTPTPTPPVIPTPSSPTTAPTMQPSGLLIEPTTTPTGSTMGPVQITADVSDAESGVRRVYAYVDEPAPSGRNVLGLAMSDDGSNGDVAAGDGRYSVTSPLNLGDGIYEVSILALNGKYDERKVLVSTLRVSGSTYTWSRPGGGTPSPTTTPLPTPTPTVSSPPAGTNLVTNGSFEDGLDGWTPSGSFALIPDAAQGSTAVRLNGTATANARVQQHLGPLKPRSMYTMAVRYKTDGTLPEDIWASYGVEGDLQLAKTNSVQNPDFSESRFVFYTNDSATDINVWVMAGRNPRPGSATFDDIRLVEGPMPQPVPGAGQNPFPTPPALPTLPVQGENLLTNGSFDQGGDGWVLDGATAVVQGDETAVAITPTETTARIVQDILPLLAPNQTYTLSARARATETGSTIGFTTRDGSIDAAIRVDGSSWRDYTTTFTTPADYVTGKVSAEFYKGNTGTLTVGDIRLNAVGGEWLDTPDPMPNPNQPALFDDFKGTSINSDDWLLADKGWGGDNGGVVPENVSIGDGVVRLEAHGDRYTGNVKGVGGSRTTRVGASLVTRNYFASGRYEVRAKIPRELGACTAFWSFHYIENTPSDAGFWEEPNKIRNSEIDWEFPTAKDDGSADDEISFDNARANTWGGKYGGEGGNESLRPSIGHLVADGDFHDYAYDWNAGGDGVTPYIAWSIDGIEVARYTGAEYGQDNVPFRSSRFWIGIWFPASGYKDEVGWAGTPDFDTTVLEIDSVAITPLPAANDRFEPETWPNGFFASPSEYP
jgi:beta-glucanase (GH16 family)